MHGNKNDNQAHNESRISREFLKWYEEKVGYQELFEDRDTTGSDPFDSAGLIGKQDIFIEFKDRISPKQVYHKGSRGSSIEYKIVNLLRQVYIEKRGRIYDTVAPHMSLNNIPTLVVVAQKISPESKRLLIELLSNRSEEWSFSYKVFLWTGHDAIAIAQSDLSSTRDRYFPNNLPELESTAPKRRERLNLEKVRYEMKRKDLLHLFDLLHLKIKNLGGTLQFNITNVNINFPKFNSHAMMGIWPYKSAPDDGICITYDFDSLNKSFRLGLDNVDQFPLSRNSGLKVGFLGNNAFIKSNQEIEKLFSQLSLR